MIKIFPKGLRAQLSSESYAQLKLQVLNRDGWRCQNCGSSRNLEVHHQQFRSHSGDDSEENLITLCNYCHSLKHR
jgi:5-methylcytosine-specific restriction endonuclease McrA